MNYEYEFEDLEVEVLNLDVTVSGTAEFNVGNDSFDYDYGSISSTHNCPDYVEDLRVTKLDSIELDDEDLNNFGYLFVNHDKVMEAIAKQINHDDVLKTLEEV